MPDRLLLPSGRLLYKPAEETYYVVVRHDRTGELRVVEDGWSRNSEAAGPFHPDDVLRAFRLANTSVPDGCELGPWQPGIGLFTRARLSGHPNDWSRVEPSSLSPSFTRYSISDVSGVINESCCAPARDAPRVAWRSSQDFNSTALRAVARALHPDLALEVVGALQRPWNVHPEGSPVFARIAELGGGFVIVDQPPRDPAEPRTLS